MSETKTDRADGIFEKGGNRRITGGNYGKALAVKCINGTFVSRETDGVVACKRIPFVGKPPVGDLRW